MPKPAHHHHLAARVARLEKVSTVNSMGIIALGHATGHDVETPMRKALGHAMKAGTSAHRALPAPAHTKPRKHAKKPARKHARKHARPASAAYLTATGRKPWTGSKQSAKGVLNYDLVYNPKTGHRVVRRRTRKGKLLGGKGPSRHGAQHGFTY